MGSVKEALNDWKESISEWWKSKGSKFLLRSSGPVFGLLTALTSAASFGKLPYIGAAWQKNSLSFYGWCSISLFLVFYIIALNRDVEKGMLVEYLQDRVDELQKEKTRLEDLNEQKIESISEYAKGYILDISESLEFGEENDTKDRITIYSHDETEEVFAPIERYSRDPVLSKRGRGLYPDDEGCIAKAYRDDEWFIADCPDSDEEAFPNPENDQDEYIRRSEQYGLDSNQVDRMRMKSRLYYGRAIRGMRNAKPIAVIIVESTNPSRWSREKLNSVFEERSVSLTEFVSRIGPLMPDVSNTKNRGF
jgi:hypothetical protein